MTIRKYAAIAMAGIFLSETSAWAVPPGTDFTQAINQIQSDLSLINGWTADQLKFAVPFNATSGNVVPSQFKLLGFDLGVSGVVSNTDVEVDSLRQLPTTVLSAQDLDVPSDFPMPLILGHAKIGLPLGFDAGFRLGGIPETEMDEGDTTIETKNMIFGIDIRNKIIEEGVGKPGVTLGFNYTHSDGDVTVTSPFTGKTGTTVDGSTNYESTVDARGIGTSEWKMDSYGLQAILHKRLLIFTPYIGASVNRNTGDVNVRNTTTGTVTLTEVGNPSNTGSDTFATTGSATSDANEWDGRLLLGTEITFFPFLHLGLYGEYAGSKNMSGSIGLRCQFR